jgi:hypothetical protein
MITNSKNQQGKNPVGISKRQEYNINTLVFVYIYLHQDFVLRFLKAIRCRFSLLFLIKNLAVKC